LTNKPRVSSLRPGGLLEALASGKPSQAAYDSLWMAARSWLRHGGKVPLVRFAGLPGTGPALTQASRDLWLRRAASELAENTVFAQAHELANELEKFITRGPWRSWCKEECPPAEASALRAALFFVAKFNDGKPISERQIHRILS
jgi:hypothetical protein